MNKDKLDKILGLVWIGSFTLALVIQDWQIRDLNTRVRRLEARENVRSFGEMLDSLTTRKKKED